MLNVKNKKILILNTTFNKGGAAMVARDLFENSNPDFDLFFAYGRGEKTLNEKTFKFGNKFEILLHIFLVRFLGLEGFGGYFSTRKLIKFIQKEKFDLIHLHNLHGYYLNFFTLIAFIQKEKIPVIWTLHDEWPITWLPAHSLGCEHCKTGIGECANTYSYPKNYFPLFTKYMLKRKKEVFLNNWTPSIICPSGWLQANMNNSFLGKFNIKMISNGINTELFFPAVDKKQLRIKYNLPLDKKIIIFSATNLNDKSKGIDYLIRAAERLKNKNYLFLGIGNGKIKNVETTGYIYDKIKFAEIYSLADLYCITSVAETFSLAAAEALACGVPVVGFDIPVVREIVNGNVGVLVELKDEQSLAEAITRLLDNNQELSEKSKNGRELILNNYSQELFLKNYSNLYYEILK
jgi:glycosyltransferase involved in cell wall biosynthesis